MKHIFSFCISIKRVFILKAYIFIYELISFQKYTKTNPTYNFWFRQSIRKKVVKKIWTIQKIEWCFTREIESIKSHHVRSKLNFSSPVYHPTKIEFPPKPRSYLEYRRRLLHDRRSHGRKFGQAITGTGSGEWSIDRRRIHRLRIHRNAQIGFVDRGFIDVAARDRAVESN